MAPPSQGTALAAEPRLNQSSTGGVTLSSPQICFALPWGCSVPDRLNHLAMLSQAANSSWSVARLGDTRGASTRALYGAFLDGDALSFDAAAFGISRTEARGPDPMPMLVLEVTYGVFRRGSSRRSALANAPVGFFLGAGGSTGANGGGGASPSALSVYSATADALSVLSGRLSYTLGLTGPCLTTDTACSSSLVAAHLAASALRLGESPGAAVTGVGMLTVAVTIVFSTAGMLSALGRCHTFDRRADGYCRGEGCGAFYFSTSGDVAVSGTAVQQDGPSASLTAPNGSSQRRLIDAVRGGGIDPVLEAHGTGTALGDPIEASAFHRAFVMRARTIRQ